MASDQDLSRRAVLLSSAAFALGPAIAGAAAAGFEGSTAPVLSPQDAEVRRLADRAWAFTLETDVQARDALGLSVLDVLFVTEAEHLRRCRFSAAVVRELEGLNKDKLSEPWRTSRDWMVEILGGQAQLERFYWHDFPIVPYKIYRPLEAFHAAARNAELTTAAGAEAFLAVVRRYVGFVRAHAGKLREQERRGFRLPRPAVVQVVAMLQSMSKDLETNLGLSAARSAGLAARFRRDLDRGLADIRSELAAAAAYLSGGYTERASDAISVRQYPDGEAFYRITAQGFLTMPLDPAEVHALGQKRVVEIGNELSRRTEAAGHKSAREFLAARRNDPKFKVAKVEDVLARDQLLLSRIAPLLPAYFRRLPSSAYASAPLPESLRSLTFGYYAPPTTASRIGRYYFPAFNPPAISLFGRARLIYHELMPGHHLQMALALETEGLHPLHRVLWNSAFAEGWGDYAASLGVEMKLYDADDDLSALSNDLFKAVRLVVDTGIGHYGWSLEQATSYMRERLVLSDAEIHTEALRYATRPGQALTYRLGYEKIWELRRRAEGRLGARFDIRDFHGAALDFGALPLTALEARVDRYIASPEGFSTPLTRGDDGRRP